MRCCCVFIASSEDGTMQGTLITRHAIKKSTHLSCSELLSCCCFVLDCLALEQSHMSPREFVSMHLLLMTNESLKSETEILKYQRVA